MACLLYFSIEYFAIFNNQVVETSYCYPPFYKRLFVAADSQSVQMQVKYEKSYCRLHRRKDDFMCALVGYEAFQSRKRWFVTLVTLMMVSASVSCIIVYVDSFALSIWDDETDTGPATLIVSGHHVNHYSDEISRISGIAKAAPLIGAYARVSSIYKNLLFKSDFFVVHLEQDFLDDFPTIFLLSEGRFPENATEIALEIAIADILNVGVGSKINYTHQASEEPREIVVVGIYIHPDLESDYSWYYERGLGVVLPSLLSAFESLTGYVYAMTEEHLVSPADARGSMARLNEINEEIRQLDISYSGPGDSSQFVVQNFLLEGVSRYSDFIDRTRVAEFVRSGGVFLLVMIAGYIAVRYNINDRKYETNMLQARGASESHLVRIRAVEIVGLSLLSIPCGILLGLLLAKIALSAVGYFEFDFNRLIDSNLIISPEAIVISSLIGLLIPMLSFVFHTLVVTTQTSVHLDIGKLAKISKGLGLIKWDSFVIVFGIILLLALGRAEVLVQYPLLTVFVQLIPYVIFIGITNLIMKGLKQSSKIISRPFTHITGSIPSWIGIRRISREASAAGPAIMILVLAMSLSWNSAIIDASLPATRLNQSRLAISGDLIFQLNPQQRESWVSFKEYIKGSNLTQAETIATVVEMHLSTGSAGTSKFLAVEPMEFVRVAYDFMGQKLDQSEIGILIENLEDLETGAIISKDISLDYSLQVGDVLRAYLHNGTALISFEFHIIGVVEALPDNLISIAEYDSVVGQSGSYKVGMNRVLINQRAIQAYIEIASEIEYFLCVRTTTHSVSSNLLEDALENGNTEAILQNRYVSIKTELDKYLLQLSYRLDRGVDTMLALLTSLIVASTFAVYASEGLKSRKREIALLRAMGAPNLLVIKNQVAEMMVIALTSVAILGVYTPLLIVNSLMNSTIHYGESPFAFPIEWYLIIPWPMLFIVLLFFMTCFTVFILAIAFLGSRLNLVGTLNATWTESSISGGD